MDGNKQCVCLNVAKNVSEFTEIQCWKNYTKIISIYNTRIKSLIHIHFAIILIKFYAKNVLSFISLLRFGKVKPKPKFSQKINSFNICQNIAKQSTAASRSSLQLAHQIFKNRISFSLLCKYVQKFLSNIILNALGLWQAGRQRATVA